MKVQRRDLLKGVLASSAVAALPGMAGSAAAQAATRPSLAMVAGRSSDMGYLAATAPGARVVRLSGPGLARLSAMREALRPGTRLAALLPEADAVLLRQLARDRGAGILADAPYERSGADALVALLIHA